MELHKLLLNNGINSAKSSYFGVGIIRGISLEYFAQINNFELNK